MTYGTKKVVLLHPQNTAVVAQLVRVPDCGSVGRRFESDLPPKRLKNSDLQAQIAVFFVPIGTETGQNVVVLYYLRENSSPILFQLRLCQPLLWHSSIVLIYNNYNLKGKG